LASRFLLPVRAKRNATFSKDLGAGMASSEEGDSVFLDVLHGAKAKVVHGAARDEKSDTEGLTLFHRCARKSSRGCLPRNAKQTDRLPEIRSTKVPAEFAIHTVEFREFGDLMRESLLPKTTQAGFLPENLLFDALGRAPAKFELGLDSVGKVGDCDPADRQGPRVVEIPWLGSRAVGEGHDLFRQNFAERIGAHLTIRRKVGKFRIALQHRSVFERQYNSFRDGDVDLLDFRHSSRRTRSGEAYAGPNEEVGKRRLQRISPEANGQDITP